MPAGGLVVRIDALLPQTQCRRCGYPSCLDYARALAAGGADLDRCPPGGEATVAALARLLDRPSKPLDPSCGASGPWRVARIVERDCIGCTLCIRACPVDAIVGASRRMHTVVESRCTGCELCLAPCPVDCIALEPMPWPGGTAPVGADFVAWWMRTRADGARRDHHARVARLASVAESRREPRRRAPRGLAERRAEIRAAVARVRARRAGAPYP